MTGVEPAFVMPVQKGWLQEGDMSVRGRVQARPNSYWLSGARTIPLDAVLKADIEQVRNWVDGKALVVGYMVPGTLDEHERPNGEKIFGCQVHAEAIDFLLAEGASQHRYLPRELAIRNLLWCGVATILMSLITVRAWKSINKATLMCVGVFLVSVVAGLQIIVSTTDPVFVELTIAGMGIAGAGSVAYWVSALRRRQLEMSPSSVTMISDGSTLPSTMLAETR